LEQRGADRKKIASEKKGPCKPLETNKWLKSHQARRKNGIKKDVAARRAGGSGRREKQRGNVQRQKQRIGLI